LENHSGKSLNENVLPSDFLMEMMDLNDTIDESKFGDSDATKMAESTLDQIKLELDHQFNDLILEWETDQPDLISKHEQFWKNHIVWYQKYKYWLRLRKNFDGVEEI
jgi:hypothetical protein